jgi:hypothetical protein
LKYMVIAIIALALAGASFASYGSENREPSACGAAHGAFADVNGNFGDLGDVRRDAWPSRGRRPDPTGDRLQQLAHGLPVAVDRVGRCQAGDPVSPGAGRPPRSGGPTESDRSWGNAQRSHP